MVTITIDNHVLTVPEGTSILKAARDHGFWIPTLCHHEELTPYGGCRLCLVEMTDNGRSQVVASCSTAAAAGCSIKTATEEIMQLRKFILELLLAEAPQAQVLLDLARDLGLTPSERFPARNELCIACGQCIRACREIVGASAIGFAGRGYERLAASPFFKRAEACIGCGTCVAICPTGAVLKHELAQGQKAPVAGGPEIAGPARLIDNWKVGLAMKQCGTCGEPFAPQFQLDRIARQVALPDGFFDVCPQCRNQAQ